MTSDRYKILVLSDTHGDIKEMNAVVEKELPFDYLFHCGDAQFDPALALEHMDQFHLLAVKGNCDMWANLPYTVDRNVGGYRIAAVHGHRQDARDGLYGLKKFARSIGVDVMLFGHTHQPRIYKDETDGILYINPGSLTENRPYGRAGTYAVLTVGEDCGIQAQIVEHTVLS